ncbi:MULTISPECIES: response regulator transcription factor [Streptomyces]|uniref:DNA-binding NarL/FixJ family response regulator n=1 Tax=Streptomyces achromogenes TaxID=67255 RepID=A0ABU0Q9I4_STRAH|nr:MULTISPECIES: LuxR C-terminal-related transcriptional regulator [Streptomyces]MDQ0687312.1 DNA-binding NarL/FixJ family response regulator [Streptomyces achromogenes]MDX3112716.1 LuxR C-terminal-related transcriptional regulator [Streptomyces scabiei]MDX3241240.1 LuxR C-terminal-related transcriptional regulator [Streptomyces sp. ME18-1-4]
MPAPDETISPPLSPQEREALLGISQGKTTAETACDMGVSDSTVKTYILRIGGKLGTSERASMVDLAYRRGYLDVPGPVDYVVELPKEQHTVLAGLAGGKTVEEIAAGAKRPLYDVRKDARRLLRALGASSAAHAVTRGWQLRLLSPATGRDNSGDVVAMAGQA